MRISSRPTASRGRAALRPKQSTTLRPPSSRGRVSRIQKSNSRDRGSSRGSREERAAEFFEYARDSTATTSLPGLDTSTEVLHRPESIHACSEASLEFTSLSNLDTDDDTNTMTLNLMDFFLFSPGNWLPELSYCKLHAACFLFASRVAGKNNTGEQIANALSPASEFVKMVGSPLADGEEAAAEIQCMISVAASDVEDGYALLYERRHMFGHLLGQYSIAMDALPIPQSFNAEDGLAAGQEEDENFDVFETEE